MLKLLSKNAFNGAIAKIRNNSTNINNAVFYSVTKLQEDNNTQPINSLMKAVTTDKGNLTALGRELKSFIEGLDLQIKWDNNRFAFKGNLEKTDYTLETMPLFSAFADKKAEAKAFAAVEKAKKAEAKAEEKKALELKALDIKLEAEKASTEEAKEALEAEKASTEEALTTLEAATFNKAATAKSIIKLAKQVKYQGVKGSINELKELSDLLYELQEGTIRALNAAKLEAAEAVDLQRVDELSNLKGSSKSKAASKKVDNSASEVTSIEVAAIASLNAEVLDQAI